MYSYNTIELRKDLWNFINSVSAQISGPPLLGGNLNSVVDLDERINGNVVTEAEVKDIRDCMLLNQLTTVKSVGNVFTWCNRGKIEFFQELTDLWLMWTGFLNTVMLLWRFLTELFLITVLFSWICLKWRYMLPPPLDFKMFYQIMLISKVLF